MVPWSSEHLPASPYQVMHICLRSVTLKKLTFNINAWFYIILCAPDDKRPSSSHIAAKVACFLQDLLPLTEAMYFHYRFMAVQWENPELTPEKVLEQLDYSQLYWLEKTHAQNPLPILKSFAQQYDRAFVQRMMSTILQNIDDYQGPLLLDNNPGQIRENWSIAHMIAEAAHAITFCHHVDFNGNMIYAE